MGKSKKVLLNFIMSTAVLSISSTAVFAMQNETDDKKNDIVVLYTNDIHCNVEEGIGFAGLAAYKSDMIAEYGKDNVTLVDCGDAIQGEAIGTLSNGEYMVDIMNAVGYDYAVFGNHEFDYSIPQLAKLVALSNADYLACNFKYIGAGEADIKAAPYAVKDYQGVKVAYVGICTPETLVKSTPTYFMDENKNYLYSFCQGDGTELYAAVQSAVDSARKEGADYVVALAHLGIEEASAPYRSTDVIANTTGIDVVLDGHSHSTVVSEEVLNVKGEKVLLSQTGTKLAAIGKLVITDKGVMTAELVTDYTKKDETVSKSVATIEESLSKLLNQVVAKSEVELSILAQDGTRAVRNQETAIGDFCADAYRSVSGADIAFVNGGGIRAAIPKGNVTYNDIINVHPYGNELCVVKATGQEILDALELGSKNAAAVTSDGTNALGESGGFLQVSGLKYTIDLSIDSSVVTDENGLFVKVAGARRVKDVKVLNRTTGKYFDINPYATYTLASHNYMIKSMGDGYTMFADNELVQDSVMLDNQVLITYISDALGGIIDDEYSKVQERITLKNAESVKKAA